MLLYSRLFLLAALLLLTSVILSPVHSEEAEQDAADEFHRNWLAVFVGRTGEERRAGEPVIGIEYARQLSPAFAIGGLVERTFGDKDFWVVAAPLAYRLGPWKFYAGPGFEVEEFRGGLSDESAFLIRVGGEYAFELGELEVAPQIDVDFVDGAKVFVFGVTIGTSF